MFYLCKEMMKINRSGTDIGRTRVEGGGGGGGASRGGGVVGGGGGGLGRHKLTHYQLSTGGRPLFNPFLQDLFCSRPRIGRFTGSVCMQDIVQ